MKIKSNFDKLQDIRVCLLDMIGKVLLHQNITDHLSDIEKDILQFPPGSIFFTETEQK
jgi:hypothetical protein